MKIFINTLLIFIVFGLPFHTITAEKVAEKIKKKSTKETTEDTSLAFINKLIAKEIIKASDKIKKCQQKERIFHLNKEDEKYIKKYPRFFADLALLSIAHSSNCSYAAYSKLENKALLYIKRLKKLGIFNDRFDSIIKHAHWLRFDESEMDKKIAKIPLPLKSYLTKRMAGHSFNTNKLFKYLEKYKKYRRR